MADTAAPQLTNPSPDTARWRAASGPATARQAVEELLTDWVSAATAVQQTLTSCELSLLPQGWTGLVPGTGQPDDCGVLTAGDEFATLLGNVQRVIKEGPYLDTLGAGEPLMVPQIGDEFARWPVFTVTARAHGLVSVHVEPLIDARRTMLGLAAWYGKGPGPWPQPGPRLAARIPAITERLDLARRLLHMSADAETTRAALDAWRVIRTALVLLTTRHNCDTDAAFDLLSEESLSYRGKLHAAAAVLVDRTERLGW